MIQRVVIRVVALVGVGLGGGLVVGLTARPGWAQLAALPGVAGKAAVAPVDVNTADETMLQSLPGVGPALSKLIVAGRPYASVDDLAKVKGIGPAKLAALRNLVTVGGAGRSSPTTIATPPPAVVGGGKTLAVPPPAVSTIPKATIPVVPSVALPTVPSAPSTPGGGSGPSLATAKEAARTAGKLPAGVKVNLNTATQAELEALPGIGPVKAKAIVAGRPYSKPEDVMKVSGIKQGIFNKIKDAITVQ
jgi:competence protein ComEA